MPPPIVRWIEAILSRPRWRGYAVLADGAIVGGGALFIDGPGAWLGLGAVASEFRGRGGQGALMALRIADAIAAGAPGSQPRRVSRSQANRIRRWPTCFGADLRR